MTTSALAVFKCLRSERFAASTRRHFTRRVRFLTALAIDGRRPRPCITTKTRIWLQNRTIFVLASGSARMRRLVSRTRQHCKLQELRNGSFAWTKHLFVGSHTYTFTKCRALRCSAYKALPRILAEAIREAAATRTSFSS